ncbi:hypothetical protein DFJ77DRAFT_450895 [Powellomyces hirtus]|nr:hypothetical protein DFJ77DRAFT_450895 [Powellomyces hirtus]
MTKITRNQSLALFLATLMLPSVSAAPILPTSSSSSLNNLLTNNLPANPPFPANIDPATLYGYQKFNKRVAQESEEPGVPIVVGGAVPGGNRIFVDSMEAPVPVENGVMAGSLR